MTKGQQTLVCRRCDRIPELVREEGRRDVIRCPGCGVFGDRDEVTNRAVEYRARSITRGELHDFQRRQVASTKRLKHVSYRPGKIPRLAPPDFIIK